jgi:hypothetical protein
MVEQIVHIMTPLFHRMLDIVVNRLIPQAGVGGAAEAVEYVAPKTIFLAVAVLAALGILFGVALAIVAARFVVKVDPKVEQVRETLPGANCGACGFAGCMGYAEAVVGNPDVAVSMCAPGKSAVAEKIAEITGKRAQKIEPKIARVFCQGRHGLHRGGAGRRRRQVLRVRLPRIRHLHAGLPLRRHYHERGQSSPHPSR